MKIFRTFIFLIIAVTVISCAPTETANSEPAVEKVLTDEDRVVNQLSAWDGSHPVFVRMVKKDMNDPASFEHIQTDAFFLSGEIAEEYGPRAYGLAMDFRGKNGFGAMVKSTAYAIAGIDSGELLYIEYEE